MLKLTKQLFPSGRAFRIPERSVIYRLFEAIALSEQVLIDAISNTLNKLIPDNDNFNEDDCLIWEKRLGLTNGTGLPIQDRRNLILRKYKYPGNLLYRSHYYYIEEQLKTLLNNYIENDGLVFRVREYHNTITVQDNSQHDYDSEMGIDTEHSINTGSIYLAANVLEYYEDFEFSNIQSYFAVEGSLEGQEMNIALSKATFLSIKKTILTIKPLNTICIIRANVYE